MEGYINLLIKTLLMTSFIFWFSKDKMRRIIIRNELYKLTNQAINTFNNKIDKSGKYLKIMEFPTFLLAGDESCSKHNFN